MSLISRIAGRLGLKNVGGPDVIRLLTEGTTSKSRQRVTVASSLQVSTVLACARAVAQDLAQCPWEVRRRLGQDVTESASDHPVAELLDFAPNSFQTAFEFREQMVLHAFLTGDAFAFKNVVQQRVKELLPLDPATVTVKRSTVDRWLPVYSVTWPNGSQSTIDASLVWHIRGPSWDGLVGLNAIRLAREAIGLAMAAEEHGARVYGNGGRPSGILTHEGTIPTDKVAEIRDRWESAYGGENAGKVAVLHGGMKWAPVSMNLAEAQNIEIRKHQVEDICRALGVFPARIGHSDKASTYASVEQFFIAHATLTLAPWAKRLDISARRALLGDDSRLYVKHNLNALLRGATKERGEFYQLMVQNGLFTRNEVRALEDRNPLDGGNVPLIPLNMGDGSKPPAPKADPVKPDPIDDGSDNNDG